MCSNTWLYSIAVLTVGFQDTDITVKYLQNNFTVCIQVIKGAIVRGHSFKLPILITGGGGKLFIMLTDFLYWSCNVSSKFKKYNA